ncbi:MAG: phage portal protein [Bryobacterales bacterium]|nr:phage portal protein [Bryobacterales bacterium]MCZ2288571.1 phage portal protein [Anaerolineales bacterium]
MSLLSSFASTQAPKQDPANRLSVEYEPSYGKRTSAGQTVSVTGSQSIATAYRAKNIITDALAGMPFKQYIRTGRDTFAVAEDPGVRNMPYLLQVMANDWGWTPFQLKKSFFEWLLFYGNGLIWKPPISPAQLFILPANRTRPLFDLDGGLWYEHRFAGAREPAYIPSVEVLHTLINPDETGVWGRGVITFARETFGRRLAANKAQSMLHAQGFMPAAVLKVKGKAEKKHREAIREAYEDSMSGTDNAYRLAIIDENIESYTPVDLQLRDSQWLQSIDATDDDIALFFGIAGHMLNRGKEAYNSNEQKFEEFKALTLDPLAVPFEEAARIRWLSRDQQAVSYFKFKREALLRMLPDARAAMNATLFQNGAINLNEWREQDERNPIENGDVHFINSASVPLDVAINRQGAMNASE